MTDPYREEFYRFERAMRARYEPPIPVDYQLDECRRLLYAALDKDANWPVYVSTGEGRTGTCTFIGDAFIVGLPPKRRRPWAVLHEAAHVLTWGDGHGPTFQRECRNLWARFGVWHGRAA